MPIFKSHKTIFIAKLALLLPLSFVTVYTAGVIATGGGHANFFPFIVVLGPLNILFAIPFGGPEGLYFFGGATFLYGLYALLLKFIKSGKGFWVILSFHVISSFVAMFFLGILGNYSLFEKKGGGGFFVYLLVLNINVFILWGLLLWLLKSIHKSRGLW